MAQAVDVKGRIIIGYHTVTQTLYVNGQPAVLGQCGGQLCQSSTRVPDYAPKIDRCTIGGLNAPPPVKPPTGAQSGSQSGASMPDGMGAMAMLLTGGAGGIAAGGLWHGTSDVDHPQDDREG